MHYLKHCIYVFCMISRKKLSIFLKNINWPVVCNGHAVKQYVVVAVAMKTTLFGDITPCSLMQVTVHLKGWNSPENKVSLTIKL